jgi:glycerophosphoryl diester phosphodiesterase
VGKAKKGAKMNRILGWLLTVVALLVLGLTFFHASWLAAEPAGGPRLVAARGVAPVLDAAGCTVNGNTGFRAVDVGPDVGALQAAAGSMADAIRIPVVLSAGQLLIAPQFDRRCAADKAKPRSTASEVIASITKPELIWQIAGVDTADALLKQLPADDNRHLFLGDAAAVKSVKAERPAARAFSVASARQCAADYRLSGLWGSMPASCKNGAMLLTLDDLGITLWGWPNRLIARAADANVVLIVADSVEGDAVTGLSDVTHYGDIAHSFNGYIWIDAINELGPALRR